MNTTPRRIIRAARVREITGLAGKECYRRANDPNDPFPAGLEIGPHSVGWFEDEVIAWRDSRPRTVIKTARTEDATDAAA